MARTVPPPRLKPEPRPGLFRRTPPAIFPPILGLLGLGIAWRRGQGAFGLPDAPVEGYLGAVSLLFVFALGAYGAKVMFRPRVISEDFRTLPGRAGLAALTMSLMMLAAVLLPYSARSGGLARRRRCRAACAPRGRRASPVPDRPRRRADGTPVMHLTFVGLINAPLAAVPLGMTLVSTAIFWYALAAALVVWALALRPLLTGVAPAAAPAAPGDPPGGSVAPGDSGLSPRARGARHVLALVSVLLFVLLVLRARWLTEAGFSGFWSAFTFPIAAFAGVLFLTAESLGSEAVRTAGGPRPDRGDADHPAHRVQGDAALGQGHPRPEDERGHGLTIWPFLSPRAVK
jgi:tellurite resistance protein